MPKILVMAGGTGGHVFPALAVAQQLQHEGWQAQWLGTKHGIEARLVPEAGIKLNCLSIKGLRGKSKWSLIFAPFILLYAIGQAMAVISKVKPDVVLGLGGFASGPGGIAAKLMGKPLVIHEQNAIAGMTNRYLAKVANVVLQAFDGALPKGKTVGNPVRDSLCQLTQAPQINEKTQQHILVLGGSLGALAINQAMPEALRLLIDQGESLLVKHQCGVKHLEQSRRFYEQHAVAAEVVSFIDDMNAAYQWADVIVCRAGALTVSEIAMAGKAALFIPFPFAVDDHQTKNALWLVEQGAGQIMAQPDVTAQSLASSIKQMLNPEQQVAYAKAAWAQRRPDATEQVAQACKKIVGVN